jgi:hypothetical protein
MSKACRKRSARTAGSVRDAERGARGGRHHHGGGRCGTHQGSQRTECDDRFAHRRSPAGRGRSRQDVSFEFGPKSVRNAQRLKTFRVASSFSPLLFRETASLSGQCTIAVSHFFSKRPQGHPRNFDTAPPLSYCYELHGHKTWKASPSLQTVADLQARPRSEVALIFKNRGAPRTI